MNLSPFFPWYFKFATVDGDQFLVYGGFFLIVVGSLKSHKFLQDREEVLQE